MHMKRYMMPKFWPLGRKERKFVVTPLPGPHGKYSSIALRVILRDVLNLAENSDESGRIVSSGKVLVDGKKVKDDRHPVGIMDVVSFPEIKKHYTLLPEKNGLVLKETKNAKSKLCSIKTKTAIKGGRLQLGLHDGRTLIVSKGSKYRPGDSLLIEIPGQKIVQHFPLREGATATIFAGKNSGIKGKIKSIDERKTMLEKARILLETADGEIDTLKDYVIVGEVK